jgi:hypothetical protein
LRSVLSFALTFSAAIAIAVASPVAAQGVPPAGAPAAPPDASQLPPPEPPPLDEPGPSPEEPPPTGVMVEAPACDAAEVEAARLSINAESGRARRWNTAWAIAYAAFAGVQVGAALAEFSIGRDFDDAQEAALYIGAGKAVLGAASRVVLPLRIPRVRASGDACTDARAVERSRAIAARKEQRTFWLQLGGGMALHLIGGGYLVIYEDSWRDALTSLGLGVVVSGLTLYTVPKTSWRSGGRSLTIAPTPMRGGAGLSAMGTF